MSAGPARVVVADDDEDNRLLLAEACDAAGIGCRLDCVEDGRGLLEALRAGPPAALVVLDFNMPILDGRRALAEMRSDPALAGVPVIVLSASHDDADRELALRLGASAFLSRPSRFADLLALARSLPGYFHAENGAGPRRAGPR